MSLNLRTCSRVMDFMMFRILPFVLLPLAAAQPLALTGGMIYTSPSGTSIRDGVVLVRDGKIVAVGTKDAVQIPRGAETLDCSGLVITAGFYNSHVHFMERKWAEAPRAPSADLNDALQSMLTRWGVTAVFDTGSSLENTRRLRQRIESGELAGPAIWTTGEIINPKGTGGSPEIMDALGFMRAPLPQVATPQEASAAARKILDAGSDGIKLYAATWFQPIVSIPQSAIQAAVDEAHKRGKPAFAHPSSREGLLAAVRGGVDVVVHTTPQSGAWDNTVLNEMKSHRVALIPTLHLWSYELRHDARSAQTGFVKAGVDQLRAWIGVGGTVLFGTDVGYMNDYDPTEEYALMSQAGMTFQQILESLTTAPAERFGDSSSRAKIAPGMDADLAVLARDPARDPRAFAEVKYTIRNGKVIYRALP